jgi:drug/metabolite transporter (DMT)-like permease
LNRRRAIGIALILIGIVFIASGYRFEPPRALYVVAGVLFMVSGVLRFMLARPPS